MKRIRSKAFCLLAAAAIFVLNFGLCNHTDLYARQSDLELVFLVDKSISMAGEPLEAAANCVWKSVYRLRKDTPISLVTFSDSPEITVPLTCDHEEIFAVLRELSAQGATDITEGLLEAKRVLDAGDEKAVKEILLLTDGRNGKERILPDIAKSLKNAGIRVYIVGIQGDQNEALDRLARDTGGEFVFMDQEMDRILNTVKRRQEGRRIRIFMVEGALEILVLSAVFLLVSKRMSRKRRKPLPNAGYMKREKIENVYRGQS